MSKLIGSNFKLADVYFIRFVGTNLIWYQNVQAGTKYFRRHFARSCDLEEVDINDIKWNGEDVVFGHLIDPLERRHRSIATWLRCHDLVDFFQCNQQTLSFLETPYLHSDAEPISVVVGDKINLINWIPIDVEGIDPYTETKKILSQHGIEINFSPVTYPENAQRIKLLDIIRDHYASNLNYSTIIANAYKIDLRVYQESIQKFLSK